MKFTIETEIDWLEDGNIDDEIKDAIVHGAINRVSQSILKKVEDEAEKCVSDHIEKKISDLLDGWLEHEIVVTDDWGDKKTEGKVVDILKARFDDFWNTPVDTQGRPNTHYSKNTRFQYTVDDIVNRHMRGFKEDVEKRMKKIIEERVSAAARRALSNSIIDEVGIDKIIKNIAEKKQG